VEQRQTVTRMPGVTNEGTKADLQIGHAKAISYWNNYSVTLVLSKKKAGRRTGVVLHSPVPGRILYLRPVDRKVRRSGATLGVIRRHLVVAVVN